MLDPDIRRSDRMRRVEDIRHQQEKQGIYKAPNFQLIGFASFVLLILIVVFLLFVFHL